MQVTTTKAIFLRDSANMNSEWIASDLKNEWFSPYHHKYVIDNIEDSDSNYKQKKDE